MNSVLSPACTALQHSTNDGCSFLVKTQQILSELLNFDRFDQCLVKFVRRSLTLNVNCARSYVSTVATSIEVSHLIQACSMESASIGEFDIHLIRVILFCFFVKPYA